MTPENKAKLEEIKKSNTLCLELPEVELSMSGLETKWLITKPEAAWKREEIARGGFGFSC